MYAGMKARWHEITKTRVANSSSNETLPLFAAVFSCDKGPETITELAKEDFFALYGNSADFFKYGQPLTQAHTILNAGGRIFGYRLVADDATLANVIITAEVTSKEENKTDSDGNQLYLNDDGEETTEVTDTPVTTTNAVIKYSVNTVTGAKSFKEIVNEANKLASDTVFPLIVVADNGRGKSVKKVKIAPDYSVSKTIGYCVYTITDIESNASIESKRFAVYPSAVYSYDGISKSMNLIETSTTQFKTASINDSITKFVDKIAEISGYSSEELFKNDVLFGCTVRGIALPGIEIDETGVNLNNTYGIELVSGTNGEFGDAPFAGETATEAWTKKAVEFFEGSITDEVWDLDLHKVDFVADANYPRQVKDAIVDWCQWRQDAYYFRDLGTDIWSYNDVVNMVSPNNWKRSPFAGDYLTTYEIIDPNSKKQIRVTGIHGMAPLIVKYYGTNIAAPLAGEFNGFVITEAIEGTLNYAPRTTPSVDQKELIDDLRVNYANLSSQNRLVIQSLYTSQDHFGPLSYSNNVILTQMAVKAVRSYTPKIRFQLMESNDFSKYKQLIEDNVLSSFNKYFKSIELIYTKDDEMSAQKIFYATIECYYKDFAQSEEFDVYAIEGDPTGETSDYTTNVIDISQS